MTEFIGVLAVAAVAWFAAGTIWNVHAGRNLMRWMQDGLPVLGSRTTVRWLGSTVAEMKINEAKPPFASVTVVIFLEPRDLPWWPVSRSLGRRDTLIIRGALRRAPAADFEALDPASWSGRDALPRVPREWPVRENGLVVHYESTAALKRAEALTIAMEARGYRGGRGRTKLRRLRFGARDVVAFVALCGACAAVIYANIHAPI